MTGFKTMQTIEQFDVLTEPERRRRRTPEEKLAIVQETFEPGKSVSLVARQHGINEQGHSGDVVRDIMLAAVERRFGVPQTTAQIEWLSYNGSAYVDHRTRSFAKDLGLKPVITPVRSPQSNGMAESFVKTMKHDYIAFMNKPDVPTALLHLAAAFEHYNEQHPHSALKYRSPREFRRRAASAT